MAAVDAPPQACAGPPMLAGAAWTIRSNRSGRSESQLTVSRWSPASRSGRASRSRSMPLVVSERSPRPDRPLPLMISIRSGRTVGSPPVTLKWSMPTSMAARPTARMSRLVRRSDFLAEVHAVLGHAVDATEVAAVGHAQAAASGPPPGSAGPARVRGPLGLGVQDGEWPGTRASGL